MTMNCAAQSRANPVHLFEIAKEFAVFTLSIKIDLVIQNWNAKRGVLLHQKSKNVFDYLNCSLYLLGVIPIISWNCAEK